MMSILEFYDLKYTYDGKQNVLRGISGKMEQGKLYAILGPLVAGKPPCSLCWGAWTVRQAGTFCLRERTLRKPALRITGAIMYLSSSKRITSLTI